MLPPIKNLWSYKKFMKLSIFTPEKSLAHEEPVQEILAPSVRGMLGILPGHAPLVSLLGVGILRYLPSKSLKWEKLALGWGYIEVFRGDVRILAESAETKESLDREKVKLQLEKILLDLQNSALSPPEREKLKKERLWLESELKL